MRREARAEQAEEPESELCVWPYSLGIRSDRSYFERQQQQLVVVVVFISGGDRQKVFYKTRPIETKEGSRSERQDRTLIGMDLGGVPRQSPTGRMLGTVLNNVQSAISV